ncbi:TIGR01777 family oxidoreductase [Agromyces mediolanus]|uniref:TIGR01777 family oxidoreductase n=1 Tax=Agromyces mediolanus TaxID=41986 RepID=UPI00203FF257|nr:TIGR01777 family oxidoreductase [Agromyces mediolanus]MCM3656778.1 TIGR01777 family oxidoreductase [Agromyces mediolanus]
MRVLVAGASGFLGTELVARARAAGHEVVRLVRRPASAGDESAWAPERGEIDLTEIERADAVVNLSGASLARLPWTRGYRAEIVASRVAATRTLVEAMRAADSPPAVLLSASAVGAYGDRPGESLPESAGRGEGFLAEVVEVWEAEALRAPPATRTVLLRSGIVVGRGGAMRRIAGLTRFGLSGRLGSGRQHWPWVALDDEVGAMLHLLDSELAGPVNLVGPAPATADHVLAALATRLRRPYFFAVPAPLLRLGLGVAADELLLADQAAIPERLLADGYRFTRPSVETALDAMLASAR